MLLLLRMLLLQPLFSVMVLAAAVLVTRNVMVRSWFSSSSILLYCISLLSYIDAMYSLIDALDIGAS